MQRTCRERKYTCGEYIEVAIYPVYTQTRGRSKRKKPTREELLRHGISCDGKRAVQVKKSDYDKYDLFVVMDSNNVRNIMQIFGQDKEHKVHKLMDYTLYGGDVADPWYSRNFKTAYEDIEHGCKCLFEYLEKN